MATTKTHVAVCNKKDLAICNDSITICIKRCESYSIFHSTYLVCLLFKKHEWYLTIIGDDVIRHFTKYCLQLRSYRAVKPTCIDIYLKHNLLVR